MREERLVALAQIIQTWFTVWRLQETVLGTLAVADMQNLTMPAVPGKRIPLILSEFPLLIRSDKLDHGRLQDVAQKVFRLDKVVTRIQVAVVFQGRAFAASRPENTDRYCRAPPCSAIGRRNS